MLNHNSELLDNKSKILPILIFPFICTTQRKQLSEIPCHGDGSGNGHIASTLAVRPRNLKQMEWQASVTDSHILQVIRSGDIKHKLSDKMPGFADKLTDQQIQSLVEYIRSLRD